jgi:hypothetical protein
LLLYSHRRFGCPSLFIGGRLDLPGHRIVIPVATWAAHMLIRSLASDAGACAIFAFLLAWNDFLVVLVFIKSSNIFTLPIGVQGFFQQNATDWGSAMACLVVMLLPSAIIFAVFNKYFSVGGIGGSTRWALTSSVDQKGQPECRETSRSDLTRCPGC